MLVLLSLSASAADLYVGPGQAYATVSDAVAAASANDTVHVAAGVYVGDVTVNVPLTLVGAGAGATVLRGASADAVIVANNRLTLRDLQVDGEGARRGLDSDTTLTIQVQACDFRNGFVAGIRSNGGAILAEQGDLYLTDSVFQDNTSEWSGGAVSVGAGDLVVVRSRFLRNAVTDGAGGAISDFGTGSLVVYQSEFTDNTSDEWGRRAFGPGAGGGAIATSNRRSIEVRESTFHHNTSNYGGGAVAVYTTTDHVAFTHNRFCGNTASEGGALAFAYQSDTHGRVANNLFVDNAAGQGGGVYWGDMGWGDVVDYYNPYGYGDDWPMVNNRLDVVDNTFVGSDGTGAHLFTIYAYVRTNVTNNVFTGGFGTYGRGSVLLGSGPDHVDYNLWWDNAPADLYGANPGSHEVYADPGLTGFSDDGDCTNDDFTLGAAVVDAGVPTRTDRDGTRSDIGSELR